MFDRDGVSDDASGGIRVRTVLEVTEDSEQTGKIGVHTLVTADELVRECQARHQASLLEPEYRCKGAREKDSLNGGEGYQTFSESRLLVGYPTYSPVGLALDAGDGLDSIEEVFVLGRLFGVCVDEEGICFGVDVLHHDLEAVEASSFSGLDLV